MLKPATVGGTVGALVEVGPGMGVEVAGMMICGVMLIVVLTANVLAAAGAWVLGVRFELTGGGGVFLLLVVGVWKSAHQRPATTTTTSTGTANHIHRGQRS
jgi:hypothetical protein